jgi:KDO2-lipid IV(A) lauroyltransferase
LEIAFGEEYSSHEIRKICKKTYLNVSIVLCEFLRMKSLQKEDINRYITLQGIDTLEAALREGNGVIVAGNHFGNWELITAAISQAGNPLHIFSGRQKNQRIDDAINAIRKRFGTHTISKAKGAAFAMIKALKNNNPLGMAGDLNVPHDNLFVDFFGKKAVVGQGLATFTIKRRAPLIFIWSVRVSPFRYKGYLKRIYYQLTGDEKTDLQHLAQLISTELEDKIRQHPHQYFWFNRRWKTRPPDDPNAVY